MSCVDRIRARAKEKGLSMSFLCRQLNVSPPYFLDIEKSGREIPQARLEVIAESLGTTVEYLRGETDQKEKPIEIIDGLDEKSRLIIDLMSDLSEEDFEKAYSYLEYLASQSKKK